MGPNPKRTQQLSKLRFHVNPLVEGKKPTQLLVDLGR